ncbi:MAG: phosphatase PAP2 family protein [Bacteroidales bacterium]|nr:phosphatase PAP2 family protein [Bacteroidales bacterium]
MAFPQADTDIFLFFNGFHAAWADRFFWVVTNTWTWLPLYLTAIFFFFKKFKKKGFLVLAAAILVILFTDQTCNLIKRTVQRPRPSHTEQIADEIHLVADNDGDLYYGGKYGFPSAHAANTAAFALFLILCFKEQRRWVMPTAIFWSLLLSYSRLYVGVHYPIDILCGWCIGLTWCSIVFWGGKRILKNFCNKNKVTP